MDCISKLLNGHTMKVKQFLIGFICVASFLLTASPSHAYEKQTDGVLFKLDKHKDTDPQWMKIQICSDNIIRVISTSENVFSIRPSLMVYKTNWYPLHWTVV